MHGFTIMAECVFMENRHVPGAVPEPELGSWGGRVGAWADADLPW